MPTLPDIYTPAFDKLNNSLSTYVADTSSDIIATVGPAVTQLMILYFVIYGIAMLRGAIEEPVNDFALRAVKVAFITGVALNVGIYNGQIASFLWNSPDALARIVSGGTYTGDSSINFLDDLLAQMYDLGDTYWDYSSGMTSIDIGPKIVAVLVWTAGVLLTGYAAFLMALAKIALAVILALGPIFISLVMFEGTKQFFSSWLGQALNFVFVVVLTSATVKLILTLLAAYLAPAIDAAADTGATSVAIQALALTAIGCLVLMQLSPIASALAGGVAVSTLGAGAAVYSKMKGAAGGAKDLATGKTLSDMRGARRQKQLNKQWAERNPGLTARTAGMAMSTFRKVTATPNSVRKAS